jgi:Cu+-exporting ATPase
MRIFGAFLAIALTLFSCSEVKKENQAKETETANQEVAAVYKNLEVEIEGMTCEIGCARLIESKLSKVEGISYSNVDFASKTGQFTYDTNKISKEEVSEKINAIAGGDLYKVVKSTEIEKITEKSE